MSVSETPVNDVRVLLDFQHTQWSDGICIRDMTRQLARNLVVPLRVHMHTFARLERRSQVASPAMRAKNTIGVARRAHNRAHVMC